jgi:hypothetical protein
MPVYSGIACNIKENSAGILLSGKDYDCPLWAENNEHTVICHQQKTA